MSRIFISYKRVDKEKVFKIKNQIESALGEKCWIDLDGIESDAQFMNVIIKAIRECEVLLFMYSKAHAKIKNFENDWTIRELNFASKKEKRIVFVNIDGSPLSDEFEFIYGTKQQVDGQSKDSLQRLQNDLASWLSIKSINNSDVLDASKANIISIIGVGGGGCKVLEYMYRKGFHKTSFHVCHSNFSELNLCTIPNKIKLGRDGLGSANRPDRGLESVLYSIEVIKQIFSDDSDIVIVMTCLGGGTGTGAAPIIAQTAKRLGKFVIGVATIPFRFEGKNKTKQAIDGVKTLRDSTDSLILIPMEKIRELKGEMAIMHAYDTVSKITSNIIENLLLSVTSKGLIDLKMNDFINSFKQGGIVNCLWGESEGSERIPSVLNKLKTSPLYIHDDYQKVYVVIKYPHNTPLTMDEFHKFDNFLEDSSINWGIYEDFSKDPKFSIYVYQINLNTDDTLKCLIDTTQ